MFGTRIISILIGMAFSIFLLPGCSGESETQISSGENGQDRIAENSQHPEVVEREDMPPIETSDVYIPLLEDDDGSLDREGNQPSTCYGPERHKIGWSIADTFEVPYEQVMTWFCQGSEFEDILLALQTGRSVAISIQELLEKRASGQQWDDIWDELGLVEHREP